MKFSTCITNLNNFTLIFRTITVLTSIASANDFVMVSRKEKVGNVWRNINVKQPKAIDQYNNYMNAVDRSDQIIAKNCALQSA